MPVPLLKIFQQLLRTLGEILGHVSPGEHLMAPQMEYLPLGHPRAALWECTLGLLEAFWAFQALP